MNTFKVNRDVVDLLRNTVMVGPEDHVLVSSPSRNEKTGKRRYVWNLHVHGNRIVLADGGTFLLVGLAGKPAEGEIVIEHVFRIPRERALKSSTIAYLDGGKKMEKFRVLAYGSVSGLRYQSLSE
jgi:hypothetical protein